MKQYFMKNWYLYLMLVVGLLCIGAAAILFSGNSDNTNDISKDASLEATQAPTQKPTEAVTAEPTLEPTKEPTEEPTVSPDPTPQTTTIVLKNDASVEVSIDVQFCGSTSSETFHTLDCIHVEKIPAYKFITFLTIEEAKEKGFSPCSICEPEESRKSGQTSSSDTKTITLLDGATVEVPIDAEYCGSKRSEVFHLITCDSVADISKSNFVVYDSVEDAEEKGKRACKICEP